MAKFIDEVCGIEGAKFEKSDGATPRRVASSRRDLQKIENALRLLTQEDWDVRGKWLKHMMAINYGTDASEEAYDLFDRYSQQSPHYDEAENRKIWNSLNSERPKPITLGSLIWRAQEIKKQTGLFNSTGLRTRSVAECLIAKNTPYLWKGIIFEKSLCCLFGAPGAGKSILAPYIGYRIALGLPLFGNRVKAGNVLYVAAEASSSLTKRVKALEKRLGACENFFVTDQVTSLFEEQAPDLSELAALIVEHDAKLVIIDTLAAAFPGLEENSAEAMSKVVHIGNQLAKLGPAVMLVHHDTKEKSKTPRGHSVFNGALDASIRLTAAKSVGGIVVAEMGKARDSIQSVFEFTIESVELGIDDDGDIVTAPFAKEAAHSEKSVSDFMPKSHFAALRILTDLEAHYTEGVPRKIWREACGKCDDVSKADKPESRRRQFDNAVLGLIEMGKVVSPTEGLFLLQEQVASALDGVFDDFEVTSVQ